MGAEEGSPQGGPHHLVSEGPGWEGGCDPAPSPAPHTPPLLQPNSSNDNIQSITSGDWDVTQILFYDEKRSRM